MKVNIYNYINKQDFDIVFIPTIVFCKFNAKKYLSFVWLFFEFKIDF